MQDNYGTNGSCHFNTIAFTASKGPAYTMSFPPSATYSLRSFCSSSEISLEGTLKLFFRYFCNFIENISHGLHIKIGVIDNHEVLPVAFIMVKLRQKFHMNSFFL